MLRISAMLLTAPIFSLDALTLPIRIMLALVLTFLIYPMVDWPVLDPISAIGFFEIVNQFFIGAMMGLMLQVAIGAIVRGGSDDRRFDGFVDGEHVDPNVGNVRSSLSFW
jgi:flagellar biosynthesis protein FliR